MLRCPICNGKNSKEKGGNDNCFHCDTCDFVECEVFNPLTENPIEDVIDMIRKKLINFKLERDKFSNGKIKNVPDITVKYDISLEHKNFIKS